MRINKFLCYLEKGRELFIHINHEHSFKSPRIIVIYSSEIKHLPVVDNLRVFYF